jgi:anti-sigma factor RsiW
VITCRELIEFLDRYVEGELPALEVAEFDRHLAVCPDCVDYLHGYRETVRLAGEAWRDEDVSLESVPRALIEAILDVRASRSNH